MLFLRFVYVSVYRHIKIIYMFFDLPQLEIFGFSYCQAQLEFESRVDSTPIEVISHTIWSAQSICNQSGSKSLWAQHMCSQVGSQAAITCYILCYKICSNSDREHAMPAVAVLAGGKPSPFCIRSWRHVYTISIHMLYIRLKGNRIWKQADRRKGCMAICFYTAIGLYMVLSPYMAIGLNMVI